MDGAGGHLRALEVAQSLGGPAAVGVHPHEARLASEAGYADLEGLARSGRIVALGELGLDYHYDLSPRETQRQAFRRQIRMALDVGLPIIVHTREADEETVTILEEERAREAGGVIHCFTGGRDLARQGLAQGFFVSFSGIVAFPRAEALRKVAESVPADRLLIETDAPYLAPPPHRGQRNEPAFVVEVARVLASVRRTTPEEIGRLSAENFRRCFRL
jgi:TatD DNase family protein